jgi:hypothetical protein
MGFVKMRGVKGGQSGFGRESADGTADHESEHGTKRQFNLPGAE